MHEDGAEATVVVGGVVVDEEEDEIRSDLSDDDEREYNERQQRRQQEDDERYEQGEEMREGEDEYFDHEDREDDGERESEVQEVWDGESEEARGEEIESGESEIRDDDHQGNESEWSAPPSVSGKSSQRWDQQSVDEHSESHMGDDSRTPSMDDDESQSGINAKSSGDDDSSAFAVPGGEEVPTEPSEHDCPTLSGESCTLCSSFEQELGGAGAGASNVAQSPRSSDDEFDPEKAENPFGDAEGQALLDTSHLQERAESSVSVSPLRRKEEEEAESDNSTDSNADNEEMRDDTSAPQHQETEKLESNSGNISEVSDSSYVMVPDEAEDVDAEANALLGDALPQPSPPSSIDADEEERGNDVDEDEEADMGMSLLDDDSASQVRTFNY